MKKTNQQPKLRHAAIFAAKSRKGGMMRHKNDRRSSDSRKSWKGQEW